MKNNQQDKSASSCMCNELGDIAIIDMGDDSEKVFRTFEQIRKRGNPFWWSAVYQCGQCHQSWLLAQESRINDVYCLHRIDHDVMEDLLINNHWPAIFDHYTDLLSIVGKAGRRVRFIEPLKSKSLRWTMSDIAADKPGISIFKLAELLNLDLDDAHEIARRVVQDDGVNISFDSVG